MENNENKLRLHPKWTQISKRMNSIARQYDGLTRIQLTVIADNSGEPHAWTIDSCVTLEPRLEMNINSLRKKLGDDELQHLLQYIIEVVR